MARNQLTLLLPCPSGPASATSRLVRAVGLLLGWALLLGAASQAWGQSAGQPAAEERPPPNRYLVLDKPGLTKRIRYYPGNRISFKLKGDYYKYRDVVVQAVGEKSIVVMDVPIFLDEIRTIYYTKPGRFLPYVSGAFMGGGVIFAGLGGINRLYFSNNPSIGNDLILTGAAIFVVGQALKPFYRRTFQIKGNRRLRTL